MEDHSAQSDGASRESNASFTRRAVLRTGGAGVGALALGTSVDAAAAASDAPPRLHTDGRWTADPDGDRVRLRGVATVSPGTYQTYHPKTAAEVIKWATDESRGWYPNVVRLPVTKHNVNQFGLDTLVTDVVRPAVDLLAERGVYALVDYHLVYPYTESGTTSDQTDPDELVRTFWNRVAPEFADDEHVLYELFNEPTYPLYWGSRDSSVDTKEEAWLTWRDAAQPWVDLVRSHAPETPLIVGSPAWTSRTNFAPQYPFDGENLIYSAHIYPDSGQPSAFDDQYGAPAEEVPVVVTEFGWTPDGDSVSEGTNSGWGRPFRDWVESYSNMGWIAWCFDDSWGPAMFESPGSGANEPWTLETGPEEHGGFVKQWLADTAEDVLARIRPAVETASVGERLQLGVEDATAAGQSLDTLSWTFGDGASATGRQVEHAYDAAGTYTIALTATDDAGESTTHELGVTVE